MDLTGLVKGIFALVVGAIIFRWCSRTRKDTDAFRDDVLERNRFNRLWGLPPVDAMRFIQESRVALGVAMVAGVLMILIGLSTIANAF